MCSIFSAFKLSTISVCNLTWFPSSLKKLSACYSTLLDLPIKDWTYNNIMPVYSTNYN